jgi:O-antigen/teichoic acid export membrane protein
MAVLSGKAISALLVNIWHPVSFRWPRWSQIVEPARLGWHLTVSRVGWAAYAQADSIVVGRVLGTGPLGTYRIATDLASAPSEKLGMLIMRVTGPFFASVQSDTATVRRYFLLFSESLALSVFPMMFGIAAISQDLIPAVLGNDWSNAIPVLRWLSLYVVLRTLSTLMGQVLTSLHLTRFMMWTSLLSAAVMVPAFVIASRWGIEAVAASWLILSPVTIGIPAFWLLRRIQLSAVEYVRVLAPAVISCTIMVVGVLLTAHWLPPGLSVYPRLGIQIMVGIFLYTSALWLLFRQTVQRYLRFLSQLRAGRSGEFGV